MKQARIIVVFLVFCSTLFALSGIEKELKQRRKSLAKMRLELKEERSKISEMKTKEKGILESISLAQRNIDRVFQMVQNLDEESSILDSSIGFLKIEIDSLDKRILSQKKAMAKRIHSLYVKGRPTSFQMVLDASSLREFSGNWYRLQKILDYDKNLVHEFRKAVDLRRVRQDSLAERISQLQQLQKQRTIEKGILEKNREEQSKVLENVQANRSMRERAVQEIEANQAMLQKLIEKLERKKKERDRKRRKKGRKLPPASRDRCWPLKGSIIADFGYHKHKVLKTTTRSLGLEIRGKLGDPIRAAADGEVVLITYIQGRGTGVIMDHGNGYYSVYGHLGKILVKEGQQVKHCREIATVGDEESMNGPKLFFQVNKGLQTIDPKGWLGSHQ